MSNKINLHTPYFLLSLESYLAYLVHLLLPVMDELHTLLQAAEVLQAGLTSVLLQRLTQSLLQFSPDTSTYDTEELKQET